MTIDPRIRRLRAAAAAVHTGLEQLVAEVNATTDIPVHAEALRLLYLDADAASSVLGALAPVLAALGAKFSAIDDDHAAEAACALEEAAGYVGDSAGLRVYRALDCLTGIAPTQPTESEQQ